MAKARSRKTPSRAFSFWAHFRSQFQIGLVPFILGVVTLALGLVGWAVKLCDGSIHSILVTIFMALGNFVPRLQNLEGGNFVTQLAALLGALTVYSSVLLIVATWLRETRRRVTAGLIYRNHVVIIGETPLAERARDIWSAHDRRTLQVIPADSAKKPEFTTRQVSYPLNSAMVATFGLHRARHVFVDLGDDLRTLDLGFRLLAAIASDGREKKQRRQEWVPVVRTLRLADQFAVKVRGLAHNRDDKRGLPGLFYLDPEKLVARNLLAQCPPFLLAEAAGQKRIHAVIIGFEGLGKQLIETLLLTSLVCNLERPAITIFSSEPQSDFNLFYFGRPELSQELDLAFFELAVLRELERPASPSARDFDQRERRAPLTAIYVTFADAAENATWALDVATLQRRTGRFDCPIFSRADGEETESFLFASVGSARSDAAAVQFGLSDDFLERQLCEPEARERLARAMHARFKEHYPNVPSWGELPESLRRANTDAADHALAKLHTLGFDITEILPGTLPKIGKEDAAYLSELLSFSSVDRMPEEIEPVVRLEHERWCLERRLDGWTSGAHRDDVMQKHPFLVPWDVLLKKFPDEVMKDALQVKTLLECLAELGNAAGPLKRRVARPAVKVPAEA